MAQTLERTETESTLLNTVEKVPGKISLVLPAHNEEPNIKTVVEEAAEVLPTAFADYEVIVVNDGSKDRTLEIAQQLSDENPHDHPR